MMPRIYKQGGIYRVKLPDVVPPQLVTLFLRAVYWCKVQNSKNVA